MLWSPAYLYLVISLPSAGPYRPTRTTPRMGGRRPRHRPHCPPTTEWGPAVAPHPGQAGAWQSLSRWPTHAGQRPLSATARGFPHSRQRGGKRTANTDRARTEPQAFVACAGVDSSEPQAFVACAIFRFLDTLSTFARSGGLKPGGSGDHPPVPTDWNPWAS